MKANRWSIMVLLLGSSFLMSCMPWSYNYYSPEVEGGAIKKSMCGGRVGAKDTIEFSIDRVTISIKAEEMKDGVDIDIGMKIPKGNEVQIRGSLAKVIIPSNENAFEGLLYPRGSSWQIGELLVGETREVIPRHGKGYYIDSTFYMDAPIHSPKSDVIKIVLPAFYINNKQYDLPGIIFTKHKWLGILPLNC